jgi:SAM-dependent methyltransferase
VARILLVLSIAVFQVLLGARKASAGPEPGEEIRVLAQRYFDAIEQGDRKVIDGLLVESAHVRFPAGEVKTKAALLKMTAEKSAKNAVRVACREVQVQQIGDTAVLTALVNTRQGDRPGSNYWRTVTWARQGGRWRVLHDQWSLSGDALDSWSQFFLEDQGNFKRSVNSLLVQAVKGVTPGKALDVGMGQGRNAVYLASLGWKVTGIDPAAGALAMARQQALKQKVKITSVLESAEEFDWGRDCWDLIALIYFPACSHIAKIRQSIKPGGLVVIEGFGKPPGSVGSKGWYAPGELRKLFEKDFDIRVYEEQQGIADWGQRRDWLVRLVASRKLP